MRDESVKFSKEVDDWCGVKEGEKQRSKSGSFLFENSVVHVPIMKDFRQP